MENPSMTPHADIQSISDHIEKTIGRIHIVFHEVVSDDLHIDIHYVKSTLFRRYEVLVTSGMSAVPMAVPPDAQQPRFGEIITVLPKGWPLVMEAFSDERYYWPLRLMKSLARLPFYENTWLGFGHTVANGNPEESIKPYAEGTKLCAAAVLPPFSLGPKAWCMEREDGEKVFFWAAVPLHLAELQFKMEHGIDPLLDLFDQHGVTDKIAPQRRSVV
ncbi:MAG: suppressor of fused domain protein [Syntrophobacteraceae bacterium]